MTQICEPAIHGINLFAYMRKTVKTMRAEQEISRIPLLNNTVGGF